MKFGSIIPFDGARHRNLKELLPWYVTGALDADEQARVDAHLPGCSDCQAEVEFQRRLGPEIAALPVDVEAGWERMRQRIEASEQRPLRTGVVALGRRAGGGWTPWVGWAVAASLVVALVLIRAPGAQDARYHALGSPSQAEAGNVLVMFKPDVTEKDLRETLKAEGARLVDGPTAAGAWVLKVPAEARQRALAELRASGKVAAAEPIDPEPSR